MPIAFADTMWPGSSSVSRALIPRALARRHHTTLRAAAIRHPRQPLTGGSIISGLQGVCGVIQLRPMSHSPLTSRHKALLLAERATAVTMVRIILFPVRKRLELSS
jgi:hypothetical protein